MTVLRLYTDEDIYASIAVALRKTGYDCLSTACRLPKLAAWVRPTNRSYHGRLARAGSS